MNKNINGLELLNCITSVVPEKYENKIVTLKGCGMLP